MNGPWSLEDVLMDMSATKQHDQNILDHGIDVHQRYRDLLRLIKGRPTLCYWNLPEWFKDTIKLLPKLQYFQDMRRYHLFHDCGKPYCKKVIDGKVSFPNHEIESFKVSKKLHFKENITKMIELDMICHKSNSEVFSKHIKDPLLPSLLLTALAEVYANNRLFGGFESESFKIKHKKILSRIKQILE